MRFVRAPFVTRGIAGVCAAAYLAVLSGLLPLDETWIFAGLGLIPSVLFGTEALPDGLPLVPAPLTLATSLFLHATWLHLGGNMLFLWVFGDNVEDAMGHARFLLFYVLCGVGAGLVHAFIAPDSTHPLIGASGAVSGVVAAYVILYPRVRVWGLFLKGIPLRLRASWAISFWVLFQVAAAFLGGDESVGWFAHLGGLGVGAVLVLVMRRPGVVLFSRA
jgi:membrane associated rhomboid family serine protease